MAKKKTRKPGFLSLEMALYGREAVASAFADYLEARALLRSPVSLAQLDEAIKDHSWQSRDTGLIIDERNHEDEPTSWSDSVRSVIAERSQVLAGRYPFYFKDGVLGRKRHVRAEGNDYARLLRITVAHAYDYVGKPPPNVIFERLVTQAFSRRGLRSHGVGTGSRESKQFVTALAEAASGVGLSASKNPLPRRRHAKDGAVDVLSTINWGDKRPGQLVWLTQVTVGQSGTWLGKLKQPEPAKWVNYLEERTPPQVMLAVPHHVERAHLYEMLDARQGTVVDRLRLVPHLPPPQPGEAEIAAWFGALVPEL